MEGNVIHDEKEAASVIANHFQTQFNAPEAKSLPMFEGKPRSLNRLITTA